MNSFTKASLLGFAALALPGPSQADNYLQNSGFENWNQGETHETFTGIGDGITGAVDWAFYNYNNGAANSYQVTPPAGLFNSGEYSLYLAETAEGNGTGQGTATVQGVQLIPDIYQSVSGWVDIVSGSAGLAYEDPNTQQLVVVCSTSQTGSWVHLSANLDDVSSVAFAVIATSANSAFYADNLDADSQPVPEPASVFALGLGAWGLLCRKVRDVRTVK